MVTLWLSINMEDVRLGCKYEPHLTRSMDRLAIGGRVACLSNIRLDQSLHEQ